MSEYAFGTDDRHVVFRLRAGVGDLAGCTLIYGDRSCRRTPVDYFCAPMSRVAKDLLFDWFEVTLETDIHRLCYAFELVAADGGKTLYYGDLFHDALTADRSEYFQLPYNHRADRVSVPAWMRDAVVYNIFPDSFATSSAFISRCATERGCRGEIVRGKLGGTIRGVTENLAYIRRMGVNCIYLNPIFAAGEYHKYDLIDYEHVDPALGTDEDFAALVREAHALGVRVMIDGVFNHCGWKFFAFKDVVKHGKASRYWDWFFRLSEPVVVPENPEDYPGYECFGYERMMPKLATDNPEVQAYFCRIGAHWAREYDIDGWRLDVASEVDDGFWRAFRRAVKQVKPDCALVGEVWETASHWLDGSMFDSSMNYDFRKHCRCFFAEGSIDAEAFDARVTHMRMRYRAPIAYAQLNLLDSHDVSRFLSLCGGDERRMKLAVLFQMTFVGMPCVFYGDEKGVTGVIEEEYRSPMPWDAEKGALEDFYARAMRLREGESALRRGGYQTLRAERGGGLYGYVRQTADEKITVMLNNAERPARLTPRGDVLWQEGYADGVLSAYGFVITKETAV